MISGIVDTTVLIHLYRSDQTATNWIARQTGLAVTSISWLEMLYGAPGKQGQARCLQILQQFQTEFLTPNDQTWAIEQMKVFRASNGVSLTDCLIASIAYRLQVPLYTDNVKDMQPMIKNLAIRPY